jgi:hypothetical protein
VIFRQFKADRKRDGLLLSDEAIQLGGPDSIAPTGILSGLLRFAHNDEFETSHRHPQRQPAAR